MIIVTGGTGFIGSALVWALNGRGESEITIVDELDHERKERNIGHLTYERLVGIKEFREQLNAGEWDNAGVTSVLHLGACSATTETDWDYLRDNNVEYSKDIIRWCADKGIRCVYASSAATYGDGEQGFSDDHKLFNKLEPLNLYGKSKLEVDTWARDGGYLDTVAGARYFNVYGPNEWHKEEQRSVINKKFQEVRDGKKITLFKSYNKNYRDGEQERDFVYVTDVVLATLFLLDDPTANGVFNIGTGRASTWNEVAHAMFAALNIPSNIEYVDMPDELIKHYQYHTQADMMKLKEAGYAQSPTSLNEAISNYVTKYLVPDKHLGER